MRMRTWWMAKEALMPAPLTDLPCSYKRLTDGPMPYSAQSRMQDHT